MRNDEVNVNVSLGGEAWPGKAMAPEPAHAGELTGPGEQEYFEELIETAPRDGMPEDADCLSDQVPPGTKSPSGAKKIRLPELVSMWKYMLNSNYANRRLSLYSFLNRCLRQGSLSRIVGFRVLNRVINREACELKGMTFWKIDREDFYADVEVELKLQSTNGIRIWNGYLVCWCAFDENEFTMSVEELTDKLDRRSEGLVMLSPFLVPYMTSRQMDAFAERVWARYDMPEALTNPTVRDATELARRMGLTVRYLDVFEHRNMDSIIFFADSDLVCGEDRIEKNPDGSEKRIKTGNPKTERILANTIVVNTNKIRRDYSAFNIFHECIHFLLHYMFFRLQEMVSNDARLYKVTEVEVEPGKELTDPIYFMEKQADRGAYGLMLPAGDTQARIMTEAKKAEGYKNQGEKYETIGKALSIQLKMPHFRMRARMVQLGHIEAKGALNYIDRQLIRPFGFDPDSWRESEVTFVIKESTTYGLCRKSDDFRRIMDTGKYVYADGHVIRNEPRFVRREKDKLVLTDEAASRVDDCCLRFVRRYVQQNVGEYVLGRMFYDAHYVEQTQFYLSDLINGRQMDELDAKMEYKDRFPRTFVDAFDQIMEQNHETRESTACKLLTTDRSLREWLNDPENKITLDFIIRITLMWQIPDWISKLLLDRAMIHVSEYDRRHQALEHIRTVLWDQGIEEANPELPDPGRQSEFIRSLQCHHTRQPGCRELRPGDCVGRHRLAGRHDGTGAVEGDQRMNRNDDWGNTRRSSYDDYDHSDEELYVYDQCCRNCRYFRQEECGSACVHPERDEFDAPADNGSDWCEFWKGRGGRH